jgi:hypothetical protein
VEMYSRREIGERTGKAGQQEFGEELLLLRC